jgi:hypothetical protein
MESQEADKTTTSSSSDVSQPRETDSIPFPHLVCAIKDASLQRTAFPGGKKLSVS